MLSINVSHAKPFLSYPYEEVLCPRLERAQRELLNGGGKHLEFSYDSIKNYRNAN